MMLKKLFGKLLKKEHESYLYHVLNNGDVIFHIDKVLYAKAEKLKATEWLLQQHICLKMAVEQGVAESISNGVKVAAADVVRFDDETRTLLDLPQRFDGRFSTDVKSEVRKTSFSVAVIVHLDNLSTQNWQLLGPVLKLSEARQYCLNETQFAALDAISKHRSSDKSEFSNLELIASLQDSREKGCNIELAHFNTLQVHKPERVTLQIEETSTGALKLAPNYGCGIEPDDFNARKGQIADGQSTALRSKNDIVLLTEDNLTATQEIIRNRIIPKSQVKQFLATPQAYIDSSLVDLDVGFSARVEGITVFKHAYFGETDESGIDWFGKSLTTDSVFPIKKLEQALSSSALIDDFETQYQNCVKTGSQIIEFDGKTYDVSNAADVQNSLASARKKLSANSLPGEFATVEEESEINEPQSDESANEVAVVKIKLNDEELELASPTVKKAINDVLYPADKLDWQNYLRTPFKHQDIGVRWILGLAAGTKPVSGGLLADDMGLGKTFMALSAIDHWYKIAELKEATCKPCLVVAPLSLLENWKDEVEKTFARSPFHDVVILQSNGDLPTFREQGCGIETKSQTLLGDECAEVRFSLKVGKPFGTDRLDLPRRLVITTYQTLRDYQFSLCSVDWGMVIFDEAQNTKNPNTLQTRAAKGLKADFKLMATGTPVENSLADFWCLMDTACPGHLGTYQDFRAQYVAPITQAASDEVEDVRNRIGRELRIKVGSLMLRRLKEDNLDGLPSKNMFVGTDDQYWQFLPEIGSQMKGDQLAGYDAAISLNEESETNMVLSCLQRLRDISLHPRLCDKGMLPTPGNKKELDSLIGESAKMQSLMGLLEQIRARNEKVIIFAVNKRIQAFLSLALSRYFSLEAISIINGDAKAVSQSGLSPTRKTMIADYENKNGFNIIIMSPVAAGVGLTVVGANNVIHFERHWNPAREAQATDRVYRIGQTKDVNIYVPVLHHPNFESFDVNLHRLLSKKTMLKDAVVTVEQVLPTPEGIADNTSPQRAICGEDLSRLSWEQFEALCAELIAREKQAESCWLTKQGADMGADSVVLSSDSVALIQCKHTTNASYEGYKAIQEVVGSKPFYEKQIGKDVNELIFMTNAKKMTKKSRDIAKLSGVSIYDYQKIEELLSRYEVSLDKVISRLSKPRMSVL